MYGHYFLLLVSFFGCNNCVHANVVAPPLPERNGDTFIYFGYGSNMLTKRIHIQNPTAQKIGIGFLENYRLDFNMYSEAWDGAAANIVPTDGAYVYGTLWEIDLSNLDDMDNQEGVNLGYYYPASLSVMLSNNTVVMARAYLLVNQPDTPLNSFKTADQVPFTRQPSKTYLQCIVKGAEESGIVPWYVDWLKHVKHNGRVVSDVELLLELEDVQLSS